MTTTTTSPSCMGPCCGGHTGAGVRICIIDEGVQSDHPNLAEAEHVEVVAVFHASRDPVGWRERVR